MSTQVTVAWSVAYSAWIVGSTGTISDCSSAKADTETARTAKVMRCWRRGVAARTARLVASGNEV